MYRKNKYDNVIISDNILVGIGQNKYNNLSEIAPVQPGLKNASSLVARIKKKFLQTVEMTNVPYSNFEILGYYTHKSSEYVYIQDQRGIKIAVDMSYFFDVINEFTIIDGRIVNDCVWACYNSKNILVPVDSELYKMCVKNTERKTSRTSIKDIKFGDRCLMEDGSEIVYLGYFGMLYNIPNHKFGFMTLGNTKKHVFLQKGKIIVVNQPTISNIVGSNTIETNGKTILEYVNNLSDSYSFVPKIQKNISYEDTSGNFLTSNEFTMSSLNILMIKDNYVYSFKVTSTFHNFNRNYYLECSELNMKTAINDNDDIVKFFKDNGFKKIKRTIKVIDPENKKELEINISK